MIRRVGAIAACIGILMSACSTVSDGGVKTNFGDKISVRQNLVFTFDADMVPDSLTNKWDETEYVRFRPVASGRFKWTSKNQLLFSPGVGFKEATDYTAEITETVTKHSSSAEMPDTKVFSFHTPYINVVRSFAQWTKNATTNAVEARLVVAFNYPVRVSQIATRLHFVRDGAELPFSVQNPDAVTEISVTIPASALNTDDAVSLTVRIDKGLALEGGGRPSDDMVTTVQVPSRKVLTIVEASPEWRDMQAVVHVATSQSVDVSTLQQSISFSPAIPFTTQITESGFDIHAAFNVGETYELSVASTLRGAVGGQLQTTYTKEILFGDLSPTIAFISRKGTYLSAKGSRSLAMRIVNVPRVRISVFRLYENNLLHAVRQARSYGSWEEQTGVTYDFDYLGLEDYADTVMTEEVETSSLGAMENGVVAFTLDVKEHTQRKGLYLVKVQSVDDEWRRATKLVSLSDIGLVAKEGADKLTVFANSINSAEPLAGVELSLISTNNQLISTIRTNSDGVANLEKLRETFGNFKLGMIAARHDEDYTVLITNDTRVDQSRFDVGGLRDNSSGLQAYIYGDRDIYRPGETIHLNTIVRDKTWKPFTNTPFKLRVVMPNGKELRTIRLTPNEQGAAAAEVPLSSNALTGMYHVEAMTATDVVIGSYNVAVEEFLPDRIKLNVQASADVLRPLTPFNVTINAMSFFGSPSAGRKYEISMRLRKKQFTAKKYPDFDFTIRTENETSRGDVIRTGTLDAQGNTVESFTIDSTATNAGLLEASFFVTVFDEGGRPVHSTVKRPVHTQPVLFGIQEFDRYTSVRTPLRIPLIACNYDGVVSTSRAHVQIVKTEWHTVMENNYSSYRYVSQKREVVLVDKDMDIAGTNYAFPFTPMSSGEYAVRIFSPGGKTFVEREFWAYSWSDNSASSFEVNTEGLIDIALDKETYVPGETAKVLFKTPFAGSLIVTIERDGVMEYRTIKTDKRSAAMELKIQESFAPNVFIAATLIKPHAKSDMPLTVAHGYQPLLVKRPKSVLPVSITATSSTRSQRKQTITVKTEPGAQVTIAVVDEGILQIRGTKTPDPHGYFYQNRALQVESYDMYPLLFPELKMGRASYGAGDGEMDAGAIGRLNPFAAKRATLIAYWSGIIATSGGTATYTFDLPQFSGAVRVMAVAWKNASFGSAEKTMTIADPIVIATALPRVFAPGDSVAVPVMITNTTERRANISCRLAANGPVWVAGADKQSMTLDAGQERVAMFTVIAKNELGIATIKAEVTGTGETFAQTTEISVRPSTPLAEESGFDVVKGGASKDITLTSNFLPRTTTSHLVVSTFPAAQITKNLGQLLGYPYGCIEQTVSKAFPQIYFADLVKAWNATLTHYEDPARNVQEAVRKVESMQTYSGGVAYWPGGTEVTWWGTVYAAHFLSEAKRAGYEVNGKVLSRMIEYTAKRVRGRSTEEVYYYGGDGNRVMRTYAARDIFYSLYLLAIEGRQDVPTMNYYKGQTSMMAQDSKYMLACTYLALGDRKSYEALLPSSFTVERYRPMDGGSFASPVRDLGFALYALVTSAPDNPQTAKLAQRLAETMRADDIFSTQENAFAVLALGKLANRAMKSGVKATITSNGKAVATIEGTTVSVPNPLGRTIKVSATNGPVYYFWSVEGVRSDGKFKQEDVVLKVRREFLDRNGKALTSLRVHQNDLIVIKVTVATTDLSTVNNVVISDVLPAGFELENPRLTGMEGMTWAKDEATAEYYDYRDDRMNLFVRAEQRQKVYYYMVRAVSKGRFRMGPIGADAMYDDDVHSYHGAGTLVVL
ncbi:MAG: MG2 domain-containing protein [bacterium]|nr:MG2 domain-containing protein [bacterium]